MRTAFSLLLLLSVSNLAMPLSAVAAPQNAAKSVQPSAAAIIPLGNQDVLQMVKANLADEVIIAKIKSSDSDFDTSPAALQQLKTGGVPDTVLLAMVLIPKRTREDGQLSSALPASPKVEVKVPEGTSVEVETAYNINSQEVREGDALSFRVVNPVKVGGVTVIASGATATGRVVKASRGGHFGRAGRLAWNMIEVTAVDGTRLPIQFSGRTVGDSKGAKVATQTIITGALLWPIAPIALLNGFKRGGNAMIPAGKRFEVFTRGGAAVSAIQIR
jgi:hypothetical protein